MDDIATPFIRIDATIVRRNLSEMAAYTASHGLALRPHIKTHKSTYLAGLQVELGAAGLTVAKPGEARVMADAADDLLMAYPAVTPHAATAMAELALRKTVRVAIDSTFAAEQLSAAAMATGSAIGILIDLDVGHHRTGVQRAEDALVLAQQVDRLSGLRVDGILCFPGHIAGPADERSIKIVAVNVLLAEIIELWKRTGLAASVVSGGSTPTAYQSHLVDRLTEIRPGTYIFNDMNCVHGQCATLDDCAAMVIATVVSTAVPGQVVLDCGSKTLTSDRCGPAPDSGHGYIVEYPAAKITKLSEEHAQVDVTRCDRAPAIGDRVSVIPNHICPCVNLQDVIWWHEPGEVPRPLAVSARGKVS